MQLSPNFHLDEFLRSDAAARHGIDMTPPQAVVGSLVTLCMNVLEPLRTLVGPISIASGYRPKALNDLIGGAPNSQHMKGEAADITVEGLGQQSLFDLARHSKLVLYDQVISEFGWVHISATMLPRRQALRATRSASGVVTYAAA